MLARECESPGPLLDEGEVPEGICEGRLVALLHRAQLRGVNTPRLVDPSRPGEAVAPGAGSVRDCACVAGGPRELDRTTSQREGLRISTVVEDDRERHERAGRKCVVAELLTQPDGLPSVRLGNEQTVGDASRER